MMVAQPELSHYSELVNRQAAEIAQLRKSLAAAERDHQMVVAKLESQILVRGAKFEQEKEALQAGVETSKIKHAEEVILADQYDNRCFDR